MELVVCQVSTVEVHKAESHMLEESDLGQGQGPLWPCGVSQGIMTHFIEGYSGGIYYEEEISTSYECVEGRLTVVK